MGCCCSCSGGGDGEATKENELVPQVSSDISCRMSSPTIKVDGPSVTGKGLALVGTAIEQDAAYWEWHISAKKHVDNIMFGVTGKKDRKFYSELEGNAKNEEEGVPSDKNGTNWMRCVEVQNGDVVGIGEE